MSLKDGRIGKAGGSADPAKGIAGGRPQTDDRKTMLPLGIQLVFGRFQSAFGFPITHSQRCQDHQCHGGADVPPSGVKASAWKKEVEDCNSNPVAGLSDGTAALA